ncbi:MAG TPA: DUF2239 family protein [Alphaproteobacteria bacterium]|nr:DUF2239 family protein [Alphaproteobacteria bacterium]
MTEDTQWTAFAGEKRIASGAPWEVALTVKAEFGEAGGAGVLTFDDATGRQVDFDLRGDDAEIVARLKGEPSGMKPPEAKKPARPVGRPRLGVVAREITLLPRHWDWLSKQRGGASVTLRRLVDAARNADGGGQARRAREAADRFMSAMLGNAPGYEEAARALYRGEERKFLELIAGWPTDLSAHLRRLAAPSFATPSAT